MRTSPIPRARPNPKEPGFSTRRPASYGGSHGPPPHAIPVIGATRGGDNSGDSKVCYNSRMPHPQLPARGVRFGSRAGSRSVPRTAECVRRTEPFDGDDAQRPGSILVPAHNEATVIGETLRALAPLTEQGVELIVVANGCSDQTAQVARTAAPGALVLETPIASKAAALRLGEAAATSMPRLYVDGDVRITAAAAADTLTALGSGAVAARPPFRYDTQGASWPVRRYFEARSAMPSMAGHAWGAGVYGLSETGRARFDEFPDLVGDDLFIDRLLAEGELLVVDTDPVVVTTPRNSKSLIGVLRRAQRGKADPAPGELGAGAQDSSERDSTQVGALPDLVRTAVPRVRWSTRLFMPDSPVEPGSRCGAETQSGSGTTAREARAGMRACGVLAGWG